MLCSWVGPATSTASSGTKIPSGTVGFRPTPTASYASSSRHHCSSLSLRLYKDGYRDGIDAIDEHGCVDVPDGPGLGVEYDWDFILAHRTDGAVYK
jgi:hypothetical protein